MKILIKGAYTLDTGINDIGIEDGVIKFKGKVCENFVPDETINADNCIAMPGLVNAHTHAAMVLLRNLADDYPFSEWLFNRVLPFEAKLTEDDIYWGTNLAIAEMIRSGTTAFADMYRHMDRVAEAAADSGIRANLSYGPITSAVHGKGEIVDIKACEKYFNTWNNSNSGRIKSHIEIHSVFLYEKEAVAEAAALAKSLGTGIHIHISESLSEQETIQKKYGKSPTQVCLELGIFEAPVIAAHCVHVNEEDIKILKSNGVYIAHNPTSNLKLANGVAPVDKFIENGINVCLGTDGASSNNNLNMFEEMHIASILHKGIRRNAECVPAIETIKMATINGAKALGFKNLGIIEPGYAADIIIIDTDKPHLCPLGNINAAVAYTAQASDVRDVIVDGRILMKNRELKTIDEEKAMQNVKKIRMGKE